MDPISNVRTALPLATAAPNPVGAPQVDTSRVEDSCTLSGPQPAPVPQSIPAGNTSTLAATAATVTASPLATATVATTTRMALLPFTRATRFTRDEAGRLFEQEMHAVWGDHHHAHGAGGRDWQVFTTLDRGHVLRVLDGDGKVRLNVDFHATFGSAALEGWLQDAVLDPDRNRLYTQNRNAVHAFDLQQGTEVAQVPRSGQYDLTSLHVTADGRIFSAHRASVVEMTPDLREKARIPVQGFFPDHFEDLPGGDIVASGTLFEEGSTVYAGYETHRVILGRSGQVRMADHRGENLPATVSRDGSYWFIEKGRKAVQVFDPTREQVRRIPLEAPVERLIPRTDGSFLAVASEGGTVTASLCDSEGATVDQFRLARPSGRVPFAAVSPDGRSAWILVRRLPDGTHGDSSELFRLDLDRSVVTRLWNRLSPQRHEVPGGPTLTLQGPCQPMVLADGRVLACETGRATLLDASGAPARTYASWQEARADLGAAFLPAPGCSPGGDGLHGSLADWENCLDSLGASSLPRTASGPQVPVSPQAVPELPRVPLTVEAGLQRLWDPASTRITPFPASTDSTMELGPDEIVVALSGAALTRLAPSVPGEHFTDAMALDLGSTPFVVAGTDQGHVLFARADNQHGGATTHVYPVDGPVTRLGLLDDGRVVAEGLHGTALVLDLPLQPGETVRAGGQKASPLQAQDPEKHGPGTIEATTDEVVVNGIRLPKRQ